MVTTGFICLGPFMVNRTCQTRTNCSNLSIVRTIFSRSRREPADSTRKGELFTELLTWAREYEIQSPEDTDAYQKTLSYIGLIYKGISARTEAPLATCRRVIALPSRVPPRFVQLAQRRQPRALVMLAHAFAMMKLLEREVPWFKGIAEKQTPAIFDELPTGWRSQMQWPMSILTRKI